MRAECEEMVHKLAREIDLGKEMEAILMMMENEYGSIFEEVTLDIWKVLIDKAEAEAYDKIKTIQQGGWIKAYGVLYRLVH